MKITAAVKSAPQTIVWSWRLKTVDTVSGEKKERESLQLTCPAAIEQKKGYFAPAVS